MLDLSTHLSVDQTPLPRALAQRTSAIDDYSDLLDALARKQAKIGIIGMGYVGLPLARAFVDQGFGVIGFDVDAGKVTKLNRGESYIGHIAGASIAKMREDNRFQATDRMERLGEMDAIIICVPTPLTETRDPDLRYVVRSAQAIAAQLRPGQLIVLESTTYPGTTRHDVLGILEKTGLLAGTDFFLAFSPEREDPGNQHFSNTTIPKVVGGLDKRSQELAVQLYGQIVQKVVRVSCPEVAEACKILENTYRAVNIALVNELKVLFDRMGIDIWEVIEAAKTKPFGFQAFYPGPGLGGHCIPIDPFYLTWIARRYGLSTRFIELAGEINASMPAYVVGKVAESLNDCGKPIKGSKIALLGMAYKKDVDDARESPGLALLELLHHRGAVLTYNDPHVPELRSHGHPLPIEPMRSQPLTPSFLQAQDCVVLVTDHSDYDASWIVEQSRSVVDTRNMTKSVTRFRNKIVRA
ncbi:MAG: nucleotide sugar dehydrogenase [Gemmataceae bacterium]